MNMRKLAGPGRTRSYIGPVGEEELGVRVAARKIPSEEWQKAHPPGIPCDAPTDADMVIQVVVLGGYGYPSRLEHRANWKRGEFPVAELSVTPYLDWRAAGDTAIDRKAHPEKYQAAYDGEVATEQIDAEEAPDTTPEAPTTETP